MSKKNKYDELANFIVQLVGGKEKYSVCNTLCHSITYKCK